jgi:hypothetical protein
MILKLEQIMNIWVIKSQDETFEYQPPPASGESIGLRLLKKQQARLTS